MAAENAGRRGEGLGHLASGAGYDWLDGGPQVLVGTEPLRGMNFGTGTVETAVADVEYCNLERGTKWSDLRRCCTRTTATRVP